MKKTIIILSLIALFAFSGCTLLTKFEEVKQRYLTSRVDQLLTEMPTSTTIAKMEEEGEAEDIKITETSSVSAAIATAAAQATAQAQEIALTEAATEEPTAEPTATPTSEPTPTPTIASSDPGIYLGAANGTDAMDAIKNWPVNANG
jgi:hypothetical protein